MSCCCEWRRKHTQFVRFRQIPQFWSKNRLDLALIQNRRFVSKIGIDVASGTLNQNQPETAENIPNEKVWEKKKRERKNRRKSSVGQSRNVNLPIRNFSHVTPILLTRTCKCVSVKTTTNSQASTKCQMSLASKRHKCAPPTNNNNQHLYTVYILCYFERLIFLTKIPIANVYSSCAKAPWTLYKSIRTRCDGVTQRHTHTHSHLNINTTFKEKPI